MQNKFDPKLALREDLIRQVRLGEISPEDAEQEAALLDLETLETAPENIDLDPKTEGRWTLIMTLVWIIARDANAVRAFWNKTRSASAGWVNKSVEKESSNGAASARGFELKTLGPPTVKDVEAVLEDGHNFLLPPVIVESPEARVQLWQELAAGRLDPEGVRSEAADGRKIPMTNWANLRWFNDGAASADLLVPSSTEGPVFDQVTVSSKEVQEIWPALERVQSEEFTRQDWSLKHAVLWIARRSPTLFHFIEYRGPRFQAQLSLSPLREREASKALLMALQVGDIHSIRNGKEISTEYWFGRALQLNLVRPFYVRRADVMSRWEEIAEDLTTRVDAALEQLRKELGRRPSQKDAYDHLTKKLEFKGITHKLIRSRINDIWRPGKQGRQKPDSFYGRSTNSSPQ